MTTNTLAERAMLVSLRMSCWLPPVVDKELTRQMADAHKVSTDRVKATKYLIDPKTPTYAAVRTALGNVRTAYYSLTLPWAHKGPRILPATLFARYSDVMRTGVAQFTDAADVFCGEWPRLTRLAIAETHGLVTAADFPDNIRDRFAADLQVMPIPTAADFRVQMADADAERVRELMREGIATQEREALALAVRDPYVRLYKHVTRMVERLSDPKGKFQDSLVTGLHDLCALMPALNITDDPQLEALCAAASGMVTGVDASHLRDVPVVRDRVAADARALQALLQPHVADNALTATDADAVRAEAADLEAAMGSMFKYMGAN